MPPNNQPLPESLTAVVDSSKASSKSDRALFILAGVFLLGIAFASGGFLIAPMAVFAFLAIRAFHKDTAKQVSTTSKTIHIFKLLVTVCLVSVAVGIALIFLLLMLIGSFGGGI